MKAKHKTTKTKTTIKVTAKPRHKPHKARATPAHTKSSQLVDTSAVRSLADKSDKKAVTRNLCQVCFHWNIVETNTQYGECRRYPPSAAPGATTRWFPMLSATDWCGEWKASS